MATVLEIKKLVKGDLDGDKNLIINGAYDLIPGKESHVSFLSNGLSPQLLTTTLSDLIFVSNEEFSKYTEKSIIVVQDPKLFINREKNGKCQSLGKHTLALINSEDGVQEE